MTHLSRSQRHSKNRILFIISRAMLLLKIRTKLILMPEAHTQTVHFTSIKSITKKISIMKSPICLPQLVIHCVSFIQSYYKLLTKRNKKIYQNTVLYVSFLASCKTLIPFPRRCSINGNMYKASFCLDES